MDRRSFLTALAGGGGATLGYGAGYMGYRPRYDEVEAVLLDTGGVSLHVDTFGAVGNGVVNDTAAFQAAGAAIEAAGGGRLSLRPGATYLVGGQDFAGATGLGYAYRAHQVLKIHNCTKPVIIDGHGATIKLVGGLKFGSFDPVTGARYDPASMPFYNYDYVAAVGYLIEVVGCERVAVRNLELDGNDIGQTIGGEWGDTGRQLAAYGLYLYSNKAAEIHNVYAHHHLLDGLSVGYPGLTATSDATPVTLINVRTEYNARLGMSWVGGIGLTAIDCKFNKSGRGVLSSSPASGFDIEAETSVCSDATFIGCEFYDNVASGLIEPVGSGRSVTVINSRLDAGTGSYALWLQTVGNNAFHNCRIRGSVVHPQNVDFYGCEFVKDTAGYGVVADDNTRVGFHRCHFIARNGGKLGWISGSSGQGTTKVLRDCTFTVEGNTLANLETVLVVRDYVAVESCRFLHTGTAPLSGYVIDSLADAEGRVKRVDNCHVDTLLSSYGVAGFVTRRVPAAGTYSAAPAAGSWNTGDHVRNSAPAVAGTAGSQYIVTGWVCTAGGTPGTWVEMRTLTGT